MNPTLVIANERHLRSAVVATANYHRHGQYDAADVAEAVRFIKRRAWALGVQPPNLSALERIARQDPFVQIECSLPQ